MKSVIGTYFNNKEEAIQSVWKLEKQYKKEYLILDNEEKKFIVISKEHFLASKLGK